MAFQRSHSKVWWAGTDFSHNSIHNFSSDFYSLHTDFKYSGNSARALESNQLSKFWAKYESPGSLKSQDSGFSDNDESTYLKDFKIANDTILSDHSSTSSAKTIETPPTIIRRKIDLSPLISTQRTHQCAQSSPKSFIKDNINRISLGTETPNNTNESESCKCSISKDKSIKRRRVINRKTRRILLSNCQNVSRLLPSPERLNSYISDDDNKTIYFDGNGDNNLENEVLNTTTPVRKNKKCILSTASTSTPKNEFKNILATCNISNFAINDLSLPCDTEYDTYPNGFSPPVQEWLDNIRMSYDHEVMSTLQTKSIMQEALKNLKITSTTVAKLVRQLQTRSLVLEGEFERVERIFRISINGNLRDALIASEELIKSVQNFSKILERRSIFFTSCRDDRKTFEENIENIKLTTKDLRISLDNQHYLDLNSLYEDIKVLKRYVLITVRLVFEKLIRVIIMNIENSKCDLMLRANLNMVATLSNIDFTGLASLNDAFMKNESIRVFLLICLDSKFSSVRALSLRALATVCSTKEAISQFGDAGGIDIIKDILSNDARNCKRTEPEQREVISLLTQITAPWHGANHNVIGLKDAIESLVESISGIIEKTRCCQTLLLCAASLNNFSRLDVTSIYSIMSNESVRKLKIAVINRGPGVSIFLYEQIVNMIYNMSINKKCHSHLANREITNFVTFILQSQFHEKFPSRAECDAHTRTIKTILHIISRIIHESIVGPEILENDFIPIFSKIEKNLNYDNEYSKDISCLSRQINESLSLKSFNHSIENRGSLNTLMDKKSYLTRQESYV